MASSLVPTPLGGPQRPQTVMPTARAASFANQQLGQLTTGVSAQQTPTPTQVAIGAARPQTAVALSAQKRVDAVRTGAQRLTQISQTSQMNQLSKASGISGQATGKATKGMPWQRDGSLSSARNKILSDASRYMGTPYVLGGTTTKGIDCSGLVMMVYNQLGYNLNHSSRAQGKAIPGVRTSINNLRPGDIVAWKDGSHIAIYAGNGQIIEAARPGTAVRRVKLWANMNAVYGIALRLPGE